MNTLPVKWAMELHEERPEPEPLGDGSAFETVPRAVVEVKDLDALREGLEKIAQASSEDFFVAAGARTTARKEAFRLLAMLPPRESSVPYPE